MDQTSPKITIMMATYNGENFLSESIHSILNQSYRNIELLISDDHSTDSTLEICRSFADKDKRIRLIERENNLGSWSNFEFLLNNVHDESKYIKFFDQDDILISPNLIQETINALEEGYDFVISDVMILDQESSLKYSIMEPYKNCNNKYDFSRASLIESAMLFYSAFNKSVFLDYKNILFDLRPKYVVHFFEGVFNHLVASNLKGYLLSNAMMGYRIHPQSVSSKSLIDDLIRDYHCYISMTIKTMISESSLTKLQTFNFLFLFIIKKSKYLLFSLYPSFIKTKLLRREIKNA